MYKKIEEKPVKPKPDKNKPENETKPYIQKPNQQISNNDIISLYCDGLLTKKDFMTLIGVNNSNKNIEGYH